MRRSTKTTHREPAETPPELKPVCYPPPSAPWRPRFDLGSLMLITVVFCVMAAAGRYLVPAVAEGTSSKAVFIIFTIAAPMLLLAATSLARGCLDWLKHRSTRR